MAQYANGDLNKLQILLKTLKRDIGLISMGIKMLRTIKRITNKNETIGVLFQKIARKHPDKAALVLVDGRTWSFKEIDEYSNKLANYLRNDKYSEGDAIALFMENIPEFFIFWLALAKLGVRGALINYNLRADSLAHCINIANVKGIIFSGSYADTLDEINDQLQTHSLKYYAYGHHGPMKNMETIDLTLELEKSLAESPPIPKITIYDPLIYIYTSGTTGLPKAAIVSHARYYLSAMGFNLQLSKHDIIYDPLPLYHSAGGMLGLGQIFAGNTVVIKQKFSASQLWEDCIKYHCTIVQYIGEICRYLLGQPHKSTDVEHGVKCAVGNGLRPQIWKQFTERFNIPRVIEFYAATEGMCASVNVDNTLGAVGFISKRLSRFHPMGLFKIDDDTGDLLRDSHGICIPCMSGEPGEMVGGVNQWNRNQTRRFDGYLDKAATEAKLTVNVFRKGDQAYRSGDILVMDKLGYLYFCDRIGDTYRWKGENVSTAEVEATVSNITDLNDAVAYGVEIPELEGKAGMVAIIENIAPVDMNHLYTELQRALPRYARPVFVRILHQIEMTGTFKLQKVKYRKQGYNPRNFTTDKVYYANSVSKTYEEITDDVFGQIQTGKITF